MSKFNSLFMWAKNQTNGKIERFYFFGGRTVQEYNQIQINRYVLDQGLHDPYLINKGFKIKGLK